MAGIVVVNEYNTAGQTKTANVSFCHFLSADAAGDTDKRTANPITKPTSGVNRSFEKYYKMEVTAMGGSVQFDTFRHYFDAAPPTGFSGFTSAINPAVTPAYATPVNTDSSKAVNAMPMADPGNSQISGTLTATGETGYVVTQLDVATTAVSGYSSVNLVWKYAEIS
jgi:hypothetical protein